MFFRQVGIARSACAEIAFVHPRLSILLCEIVKEGGRLFPKNNRSPLFLHSPH